jgi:hypothetical protein
MKKKTKLKNQEMSDGEWGRMRDGGKNWDLIQDRDTDEIRLKKT